MLYDGFNFKFMKTTFERLADKIYKDTGYVVDNFKRSYYKSRDAGEFSWFAYIKQFPKTHPENYFCDGVIGSSTNATNLLKQKKIEVFYPRRISPTIKLV